MKFILFCMARVIEGLKALMEKEGASKKIVVFSSGGPILVAVVGGNGFE